MKKQTDLYTGTLEVAPHDWNPDNDFDLSEIIKLGEIRVTFINEKYFELKIIFLDGSYRNLYISQKARWPKGTKFLVGG